MKSISTQISHLLDEEKVMLVARIIDSSGSSPRSSGWMLIEPSGCFAGSVGGGALEGMVLRLAKDLFAEKRSMLKRFELNGADEDGLDMRCGGSVDIQLDYVDGADFRQAEAYRSKLQELEETQEVFIIGAGHVGLALAKQLALLGIPVIAMDDRAQFANKERFAEARQVVVLENFDAVFEGFQLTKDSCVVIVTRGHRWDLQVLAQALATDAGYIGMIGSRKKIAGCYESLREQGVSEERLSQVDAPIGLQIPCETPEEIAVSIAAKLLCVKYGKEDNNSMK